MYNIYKITNLLNNKVYIGQTTKLITERLREHTFKSSKCLKIRNAIQKYGKDNFTIELLSTCDNEVTANNIEIHYISLCNSIKFGYNISNGGTLGTMTGRYHSKESKCKMSETHKGKIVSEEIKKKISETNIGKHNIKHSEKTKSKISISKIGLTSPMLGKKHLEETKIKISKAHSGKTWKIVDGKRVWISKGICE